MTKHSIYYLLLIVFILNACSNTKYLPKGQKLYTGGQVKIVDNSIKKSDAKALRTELQGLLRPVPNSSILGLRWKLYIYNKTKTKKKRGFRHWLNTKFGEPPVLVSSVDLNKNSQILQNRLQNESYFQAQVTGDTISKGRTAKAVYTAVVGPSYKIRKVIFPTSPDNLDTAVAGTSAATLLKVGDKYNLDVIKNERIRIDARLKEEGFYYFAPEDLIMRVDSSVAGHQVHIFVTVKPATPDKARRIYTINNIYVYPQYTLRDTSLKLDSAVKYRWYNVIDPQNTVRPFVFKNSVLLNPGERYNLTEHNQSLNRFMDLGPFKFVKNRFEDVSTDSPKLNVFYFLSQYPKKSLQFEIEGHTTSANYNGSAINFTWKNRNAFKGAEALSVNLFYSTDAQISGQNGGYPLNQYGVQTTLSWPRFISPFDFKNGSAFIPRTNLSVGFSIVRRSLLYSLDSYNGSWGYTWKPDIHTSNELHLLDVTYVRSFNISKLYLDSIRHSRNPALAHVIASQFTFGPSYSYTWTNTTETYKTNTLYYNGKFSSSANILGLVEGADTLAGKVKKLLGTPYNQYLKLENEFRFFHKLGPNSKLAMRALAGVGLPYGNSTILPYSQQFFIGGANSLRGFRARSIGPGTVRPDQFGTAGTTFLPDESGDIRLEANIEYRPKLFSIVYGALFMDAGNIWDMKYHTGLEGGTFGKNFYKQLAYDAGFGLRFDVNIMVLRTDLGFPIHKPWESGFHFNRREAVFNLAIGYPF